MFGRRATTWAAGLLALTSAGCLSARVSVGPTTDFGGHYGFEVLAGLGLGFKTTERSTMNFSVNAGGGLYPETEAERARGESGPNGAFVDEIGVDHIFMPDKPSLVYRVGARAGFRAVFDGGDQAEGAAPPQDNTSQGSTSVASVGGAVALLPVLGASHSGGDIFRDTWVALGPEVEIDWVTSRSGPSGAHGRLSLALEFDSLSQW